MALGGVRSSHDKRILVVEDDDDVREVMQLALETNGYRVDAVADGREALTWLTEHPPPALILLDLMMPVMNGWEVLEALEEDNRLAPIPVVVVTAFRSDRLGKAATRPILRKPVELDGLLGIVALHLDEKVDTAS
jgi:CheY-like chemotaxis protein